MYFFLNGDDFLAVYTHILKYHHRRYICPRIKIEMSFYLCSRIAAENIQYLVTPLGLASYTSTGGKTSTFLGNNVYS